jgi:hypothetical protein
MEAPAFAAMAETTFGPPMREMARSIAHLPPSLSSARAIAPEPVSVGENAGS